MQARMTNRITRIFVLLLTLLPAQHAAAQVDLAIGALTSSEDSVRTGGPDYTLTATVTNSGDAAPVGSVFVDYYVDIVNRRDFSRADRVDVVEITTLTASGGAVPSFVAGASSVTPLTTSARPLYHFACIRTDDNDLNSCTPTIEVELTAAAGIYLLINQISGLPNSNRIIGTHATFTARVNVLNRGDAGSPPVDMDVYQVRQTAAQAAANEVPPLGAISALTPVASGQARGVGGVGNIRATNNGEVIITIAVPATPGVYYYYSCVRTPPAPPHPTAQETCFRASASVTVVGPPAPDIRFVLVNTPGSRTLAQNPGDTTFSGNVSVVNDGPAVAAANSIILRFYRSADNTLTRDTTTFAGTNGDTLTATTVTVTNSYNVDQQLAHGGSFPLPPLRSGETFNYIVCADHPFDFNFANNCADLVSHEIVVTVSGMFDDFAGDTSTTGRFRLAQVIGEIELAGDTDWFAVPGLTVGNTYRMTLTEHFDGNGILSPVLTLRNAAGDALATADESGENSDGRAFQTITAYVLPDADVYVEVSGGGNAVGTYRLSGSFLGVGDLTVAVTRADTDPVPAGGDFDLTYLVSSASEPGLRGSTLATVMHYYHSTDAEITTADTIVQTGSPPANVETAIPALGTAETFNGDGGQETITLTLPAGASGTIYYGACVVPALGEFDDDNNCSPGVAVAITAPASITATNPDPLVENTLNGATLEVTLAVGTYAASLTTANFTVSTLLSGLTLGSVVRDSDTQATLTLAYDGTDFDTDETIQVFVLAAAHTGSGVLDAGSVTVTAIAENNVATLSALALSGGVSLTPPFDSGTFMYTAAAANSVTDLVVTPTASDDFATIAVNGNAVDSGAAAAAIALTAGMATDIDVLVTASDGVATRTYNLAVTRSTVPDVTCALGGPAMPATLALTFGDRITLVGHPNDPTLLGALLWRSSPTGIGTFIDDAATNSAIWTAPATDQDAFTLEYGVGGMSTTCVVAVTLTGPLTFAGATIDAQIYPVATDVGAVTLPVISGGAGGTITYTLAPALPAGLTFDGDATPPAITGAPEAITAEADYTYTAAETGGDTLELDFTLEVTTAPVTIAGGNTGSVVEAGTSAGTATATGTLTITNPNPGGSDEFVAITASDPEGMGTYGDFTIAADTGVWTYTLDNADDDTNALAASSRVSSTFTVAAAADNTVTQVITISITGANDAPTATITAPAEGMQVDFNSTVTLTATGSDPDTGTTLSYQWSAAPDTGSFANAAAASTTWTAPASGTDPVILTLTVMDDATTPLSGTATVTVIPVAVTVTFGAGGTTGAVTEGDTTAITGALDVTSSDGNTNVVPQTGVDGLYGAFSIDTAGAWTYTLDNTNAAINALAAGATLDDPFTVAAEANTAATVVITITITGANDPPTVAISAPTEGMQVNFNSAVTLTATGADPDTGTTLTYQWSATPNIGSFADPTAEDTTWTVPASGTTPVTLTLTVMDDATPSLTGTAQVMVNPRAAPPADVTCAEGGPAMPATLSVGFGDQVTLQGFTPPFGAPLLWRTMPAGIGAFAGPRSRTIWTAPTHDPGAFNVVYSTGGPSATCTVAVTLSGPLSFAAAFAPQTYQLGIDVGTVTLPVVSAGAGAATYALTPALPAGLTFDAAATPPTITGTPEAIAAEANYAYTATTAGGALDLPFTLEVTLQTITINAATAADTAGAVTEDAATDTVTGTLTITNPNPAPDDSVEFVAITASEGMDTFGTFTITAAGAWTYTLDNAAADTNSLAASEGISSTFTVAAAADNTVTQNIIISITGANDAPTARITAPAMGAEVFFNGVLTLTGSTSSDPDISDTPDTLTFAWDDGSETTGTFGDTSAADTTWTAPSTGTLGGVTLRLTVTDSTGATSNTTVIVQLVALTITFADDLTGAVTEDGDLTDTGALTVTSSDPTGSTDVVVQTNTDGDYGLFSIAAGGAWTYTLGGNPDNETAVNALPGPGAGGIADNVASGAEVTDTFTVTAAAGGTPQDVVITITGANDPPTAVISAPLPNAQVDFGATVTLTGSATDPDTDLAGDLAYVWSASPPGRGSFTDNSGRDGIWIAPATVGAVTLRLTVDEIWFFGTRDITEVTVNPVAPAVDFAGSEITGAVTEDAATDTATGALTLTTTSTNKNVVAQTDTPGTYGSFTIDAAGAWTYTLNNANAATNSLPVGQILEDTFTVVASVNPAATVDITIRITGANDAPTVMITAPEAGNTLSGRTVTLEAIGEDVDLSAVLAYAWTTNPANQGTFANAASPNTTWTPPTVNAGDSNIDVTLTLTVNDNAPSGAATATATLDLTVTGPGAPTAAISATAPGTLTEADLSGATLMVMLTDTTYEPTPTAAQFRLAGVTGVTVSDVARDSNTEATLTLAFDRFLNDFDTNASLTVTVLDAAHTGTGDLNTGTETVTAIDESDVATLAGLTLSGSVPLNETFAPATLTYTADVANDVTDIMVTPTATDATGATITVNGDAVNSGAASTAIVLTAGGATSITVVVTAEDGSTTQTYTLTVTRAALALSFGGETIDAQTYTANTAIADLTLPTASGGTGTLSYALSDVPSGLTFAAATRVLSGTPDAAQAATTYTYTATDAAVSPASVMLDLVITVNAVVVPSATISATTPVTLTEANLDGATLTVTLTSTTYADPLPADPITLDTAATTAGVTATAVRDSATEATLTLAFDRAASDFDTDLDITVTVAAAAHANAGDLDAGTVTATAIDESDVATLSALTLSGGATLTPVFDAGTFTYTADVDNSVANIMVTPTATDAGATIEVQGTAVTSGSASTAITLTAGVATDIAVLVTAEDGTTQTYNLAVTRAAATTPTAAIATPSSLTEATLDGATVTVMLTNTEYVPGVLATNLFTVTLLSGSGVTVSAAVRTSAVLATLTLAYGGTGIDANTTLGITVLDAAHSGTGNLDTATIPVTATAPSLPGATFSVAENAAANTPVGTPLVPAEFPSGAQTWAIESGNDDGDFNIAEATGQLTVAANDSINFEDIDSYTLVVSLTIGTTTAQATVTVTVSDENEPPLAPAAPTVTAAAVSLNVNWTAPDNNGPAITSYDVQFRTGGGAFTVASPGPGAATSLTITGLTASTLYEVQVRAVNAEGNGAYSASGSGTPLSASAPTAAITTTAPTTLTEANLNGAMLTVTLTNATYTGPLTMSQFTLTGTPGAAMISVASVTGSGAQAVLVLSYTGADLDSDLNLSVVVDAAAHTGTNPLTTGAVAVDDNVAPVIVNPGPQSYVQNAPITALTITVNDADGDGAGTSPTVTLTSLPTGLVFDGTDQVTGTPTELGDTVVTITADDGVNDMVTETFTITVTSSGALSFGGATIDAQTYTVNTAITDLTLPVVTGGTGPYGYALPDRPSGLSFNAMTRVLSGTPDTEQMATTYTYTATDSALSPAAVTLALVVTVEPGSEVIGGPLEGARSEAMEMTLGAFGRSFASGAVEVLGERFSSGVGGSQLTFGGRTLSLESLTNDQAVANAGAGPDNQPVSAAAGGQQTSVGALFAGSAFQLSLNEGDAAGVGATTLWARGAVGNYEGEPEDGFQLDGDIVSGYLGLDYRASRRTLVGVAVSHSRGDADFSSAAIADGEVETELTSILPYVQWQPHAGLSLWGLVGYGLGESEITDSGESRKTDVEMQTAALGARGKLWSGGRVDVALKASALTVEIESDSEQNLSSVTTRAHRLRMALAGNRHGAASARGGRFGQRFELGLRWDLGDVETGAGADLGAGVEYANPRSGTRLRLDGHYLLVHEESDFEAWEVSAEVGIAPSLWGRGVRFALQPGWDSAGARQRMVMDFTDVLGPAWRGDGLKLELYGEHAEDHEFGLEGSVRY